MQDFSVRKHRNEGDLSYNRKGFSQMGNPFQELGNCIEPVYDYVSRPVQAIILQYHQCKQQGCQMLSAILQPLQG